MRPFGTRHSTRPACRPALLALALGTVLVSGQAIAQSTAPAASAVTSAVTSAAVPPVAARGMASVPEDMWDRPRSADAVRELAPIRVAVGALLQTPGAALVIRHARGQNEQMKAEELRSWLVALGVDESRIEVTAEARSGGVKIETLTRGALQ